MTGTDTTAEQWATIPGFDGVYEVSSVGNVRNVVTGRMLKPRINHRLGTGYRQLTLKASPERRSCYVHALVLEAFVGPRPAGMHVRHLNGNSLDNRLDVRAGSASSGRWHQCRGARGPGRSLPASPSEATSERKARVQNVPIGLYMRNYKTQKANSYE